MVYIQLKPLQFFIHGILPRTQSGQEMALEEQRGGGEAQQAFDFPMHVCVCLGMESCFRVSGKTNG